MNIKLGNIDAKYIKVGSDDCKVYLGNILVYSGGTPHDYSKDYFTVRALEDFDIVWGGMPLSYSIDGGTTWSEPSSDIILSAFTSGSTVMFKGNVEPIGDSIGRFNPYGNGKFEVEGNIMSLIFGDNFVGQTDLTGYNKVFSNMFFVGKKIKTYSLISAENLVLPATTLSSDCYAGMFYGCAALVTPPKILPATTLASGCYYAMFNNCTSLTTAPELPATTLTDNCYRQMFANCASITTAPILPAETIKNQSYRGMFMECTSLSSITCLATDISATRCTYQWVTAVAASGTFTKAASMNDWTEGTSGIPSGWTVQDYSS